MIKNNKLISLLVSLPIILLFLYFIPFLGICLLIANFVVNFHKKKNLINWHIGLAGLAFLIPKAIETILFYLKININQVPILKDIIASNLYQQNILQYAKLLIIIGVISYIISYFIDKIYNNMRQSLHRALDRREKRMEKVTKENDMIVKKRKIRAQNTKLIECPNCGAEVLVDEYTTICPYCRSPLLNKPSKK